MTRTSVPGAAEKNKGEWTCLRPVWAPPPASGGLYSGAICSPLPTKPCSFVPGSKIFTEIPRRRLPPAAFSAARFAPRSPQSLAASFRGAKSSYQFRAAACLRRPFQRRDLLPVPRKALRLRSGEQNLHRNSAPLPISTIPRCKELTTKALSSSFRRQFPLLPVRYV